MQPDCCSAWRRGEMKGGRQGSLSDGGARSQRRVQVCARSRDEESRKRRRCLTVGGEGEDSGCQIGSLRLWNPLRLYTKKHTLTNHMKSFTVWGGRDEDVERGIQRCSARSQEWQRRSGQQGVNALWWPLSWAAPLSRNGRVHQIQLHKPHWNLTPVSMETNVSHSAQKHAKC